MVIKCFGFDLPISRYIFHLMTVANNPQKEWSLKLTVRRRWKSQPSNPHSPWCSWTLPGQEETLDHVGPRQHLPLWSYADWVSVLKSCQAALWSHQWLSLDGELRQLRQRWSHLQTAKSHGATDSETAGLPNLKLLQSPKLIDVCALKGECPECVGVVVSAVMDVCIIYKIAWLTIDSQTLTTSDTIMQLLHMSDHCWVQVPAQLAGNLPTFTQE